MRKIYIECGTTIRSQVNSGIQRVVKSVLREAALIDLTQNIYVPVEYANDTLNLLYKSEISLSEVKPTASAMPQHAIRMTVNILKAGLKRVIKPFLRATWRARLRTAYSIARNKRDTVAVNRKINWDFAKTDNEAPILLLLDSSWHEGIFECVTEFRAHGGFVCAVLYDLIPFSHPETVQDATRHAHTSWWKQAPKYLDSVICISQNVTQEFLEWQQELPEAERIPEHKIDFFYLGSELPISNDEIPKYKFSRPYYLMVGSIEPRKNHALVLDAFEKLWSQGVQVDLVIVGAYGWHSEALIDRILTHPEFGNSLFLLRDANDNDLATLYTDAIAVICASFAEGFGLSVVEGFQRGTRVLCSDIPVFREIAGENAQYFDPFDAASLVRLISDDTASMSAVTEREKMKHSWLSWRESTEQLFQRTQDLANRPRSR